jgi:hypothetical protein
MPVQKPVISKRLALLAISFTLLGAAAGSGITYTLTKRGDSLQSSGGPTTGTTDGPIQLDKKLPEGTISPGDFILNIDKYYGKESVKVRGLIIATEENKYILADQEGKGGRAVNLDFSGTNIDPKPYVAAYASPDKKVEAPSGPVTVTFKATEASQSSGFKVLAIDR